MAPFQIRTTGPQCTLKFFALSLQQGRRYKTGDHFKSSPCNHCSCNNGHVTCRNTSCGVTNDKFDILACEMAEAETTREGNCCPECLPSEGTFNFAFSDRFVVYKEVYHFIWPRDDRHTDGRTDGFPLILVGCLRSRSVWSFQMMPSGTEPGTSWP